MKFHEQIAEYLPSLRRYSHAITGDAAVGDAQVAALLKFLLKTPEALPGALPLRLGLYRHLNFAAAASGGMARASLACHSGRGEFRDHVQNLPRDQRQALLLVVVERLSVAEAAQVLGLSENVVHAHVAAANRTLALASAATEILVIGEHQSAADALSRMLGSFGYAVMDVANSLQHALAIGADRRPGLVVADLAGQHAIQRIAAFAKSVETPLVYISKAPVQTLATDLDKVLHVSKPAEPRAIKRPSNKLYLTRQTRLLSTPAPSDPCKK